MLFIGKKKIYYKNWIIEWLLEQKNYIKESTYANYSSIIFNHLIPELGDYYLSDIDNKMLQNLILKKYKDGRLDGNGGLSDKTIKDITILMKTSLKYAVRTNLINNINLDFLYPKSSKKDKIFVLSQNEQRKIMNYVIKNKDSKNIGILLTLYSGLRIGELCALKWKDIDFKKNILHINKTIQRVYIKYDDNKGESKMIITTPKTKNANRDIPLNNEFAILLKHLKTNDEDYILSCKKKWIEPRTYRKHFDRMLNTLNIDHVNFHCLRHTFATNCIRLGTDYKTVSELLGHSSVNITLNLYVHPQMSQKKKCINLVCKEFQFNEL
jgi:integrase